MASGGGGGGKPAGGQQQRRSTPMTEPGSGVGEMRTVRFSTPSMSKKMTEELSEGSLQSSAIGFTANQRTVAYLLLILIYVDRRFPPSLQHKNMYRAVTPGITAALGH